MRAWPVSQEMTKLCPFRKRRVAVAENEWEEQFMECLREECAMWAGDGCGQVRINSITDAMATSREEAAKEKTTQNDDGEDQPNDEIMDWISIKVLEAKETKNPGTVRAWCQFVDDANKEAFFAKKAAGKALLQSVGKRVAVKYRRMDDGTAFVIFVKAEW
ncbi:MAG: hypothetical protein JL56_07410 [Desulfotomaculum sp. BICA1-6]|nr:MAG: hypothetical protein JL56_07410 [Desulfotomaculum sp. BICA1-6]